MTDVLDDTKTSGCLVVVVLVSGALQASNADVDDKNDILTQCVNSVSHQLLASGKTVTTFSGFCI